MSIEEMMRLAQAPEKPKRALPTCTRERTQYRRLEDEDAGGLDAVHFDDAGEIDLRHYNQTGEVRYRPEPELQATVPIAVVPEDIYQGLIDEGVPPEWMDTARQVIDHFQEPVSLPPDVPPEVARPIMAAVFHMRHHNRMPLRLREERPTDPRLPGFDLSDSIDRLCRLYKEETLARAGHRTMAHGVFPVYNKDGEITSWRVQIWDTSKEKRNSIGELVIGGKLHIAYKPTEEEAWSCLADWFLKHRGLDVRKYLCYHPESGIARLAGMMKAASREANDYVEVDAKEIFGGSDEDDWD